MQGVVVLRRETVRLDPGFGTAFEQLGEFAFVRRQDVDQRPGQFHDRRRRRRVVHGGDRKPARQAQRALDRRRIHFLLRQQNARILEHILVRVDMRDTERHVRARSDHDQVLAGTVEQDGRSAGGFAIATLPARLDVLGFGQRRGAVADGIATQGAEEKCFGAEARGGHGLVETLAARSAGKQAEPRFARLRKAFATPDVVLVERTDDDDSTHAGVAALSRRVRSARRRSSPSSAWRSSRRARRAGRSARGRRDVPAPGRRYRRSGWRSN